MAASENFCYSKQDGLWQEMLELGRKGEGDIGHLHAIYFFQKQQKQHIYCSRAEHAFRDIKAYLANFLLCIFCFVGKTNIGDGSAYCRLFLQFMNSWHPSVYPPAALELNAKRVVSALANSPQHCSRSIVKYYSALDSPMWWIFIWQIIIIIPKQLHLNQTSHSTSRFWHCSGSMKLMVPQALLTLGYQMGSDDHDED